MCGICGFYEFDNSSSEEKVLRELNAMCGTIAHRGPDDTGTYISNMGMNLGANRLSIIDLSGGHQPISNEDGSYWVVQNGEIYNYPALRRRLESLGHTLRTNCDTEAIVHAYEEWGTDCPKHLEGMFAFAIVDKQRQRMMLVRDRLGKKPLYYSINQRALVFGSEIKALMAYDSASPELDQTAVDMFLTLGYIPGPHSIYKEIKKLLPGHYLIVNCDRTTEMHPYWDLPASGAAFSKPRDFEEAAQQLTQLLEKSVKDRLLADVPIGVFLSGGLDSSLVTALTHKFKPGSLKSFSVSFTGHQQDESSYSELVANSLGTEHFQLDANECTPDLLRKLVWHCDEPLADPAIVPTYLVSKLAKEQVTVVLTGEGADEFFGGYFYHPLMRQSTSLDWMPLWARQNLLSNSAKLVNQLIGRPRYHPRTLWSLQMQPGERLLAWVAIFTDEEKQQWFSPAITAIGQQQHAANHFRQVARNYGAYAPETWLNYLAYTDAKIPLVDDLLMKVDKMSMAASLEARCPFLDHQVVEFAFHLPDSMKLDNAINKRILRRVASKVLPKDIFERQKHGFDVPLKKWLTEDLAVMFWDVVTSRQFEYQNIISRSQIQSIWESMVNNVDGSARQIWSILILAIWFDVFKS